MPASYSNVASASGTTLGVSTSVPNTHDVSGFEAVVFSTIGQVEQAGLPGQNRNTQVKQYLDGTSATVIGAAVMEAITVTVTFSSADAGQTVVRNNANGTTRLFWEWTMPSGDKVWCAGYATGFRQVADDVEDTVKATWQIVPQFDTNGVGEVSYYA